MSDSDTIAEAEKAKLLGNEKMKEADYIAAAEQFSKATELDSTNHVFYSNRSAAFLLQGMHVEALADAEKCIELNPSWGKGYARKGEVLEAMQEFTKAQEAYRKAKVLGHASSEPNIKALKPTAFLDRANWYLHLLRQLMVLSFIVYVVPSPENLNPLGYRICLVSAFVLNLSELCLQYGRPSLTAEYWRHLILNYRTHYMISALIFLLHDPFFFGLVPLVLNEIGFIAHYTDLSLRETHPDRLERYDYVVDNYIGPLLTSYNGYTWMAMDRTAKWTAYNQRVLDACASFEVATVFVLIINLFTRHRNIIVTVFYCQFMRIRYIQSPYVKMVFNRIHTRVKGTLGPIPVVGQGYEWFANKLYNWAKVH
mmetsp:Transcript_22260/g.28477  ORF Transcript_22260/g.28477 Transcript_22260/m.28477 type:complete len:368 (+) Transcript_22260:151-1254(+)